MSSDAEFDEANALSTAGEDRNPLDADQAQEVCVV
ncbi:hypothetical protein PF010_g26851 [Phytophthora fragariae]|uniref:Uncharacterized protein n=1 Tax=Phytophthora fragariae TaxID=53985 RepID=A0A6G0JVL5_9STRA|nr:hypothetical protein PF010_g26851 [Phytophthora fragariae]